MIHWIYARRLWQVTIAIIVFPLARAVFGKKLGKMNSVCLVCSVCAVLYVTLFRSGVKTTGAILIPLYSFVMAQEQPEMYRELLMNVFLFVPVGMFLPFEFKEKGFKKAVLIALCLSAAIEIIQYLFKLGLAEIDDVLSNTLGAAIGATSYLICNKGSSACSQTSMKE